jgi:hypothetical protein
VLYKCGGISIGKYFRWLGPENLYVGDAGGAGARMSKSVYKYDCEQFAGFMKEWRKNGWIEEIVEEK